MSIIITYFTGLLANTISGFAFHLLERWRPFRSVDYGKRFWRDFGSLAYVWILFALVNAFEVRFLGGLSLPWLAEVPLWITLPTFFLIYDFGAYWAHRLMHTSTFWRTHVWHHTPKQLWWLSGCRASAGHVFLYRLAYLPFFFCLFPPLVAMLIASEMIITNSWVHLNLQWYPWMRKLEWLLVTPRYHQLHHGVGSEFRDRNFAARFTFWDRWFGTFLDPDTVDPETLEFGVSDDQQPTIAGAALGI